MKKGGSGGRLEGRSVLITGAGRGIGKGVARRLGEEGAAVALVDLDEKELDTAATQLEADGIQVVTVPADVTVREQVEQAVKVTIDVFGRLDILVNNAGVIRDNLLFKMTDEDWERVMDVHLKGTFYCSQTVQQHMVEQKYGRIINLSSTSALGNRGQANYSAAKAGIQGFTKTLAIELGKFGITVNAVAPGFIETEMTRATAERMNVPFDVFTGEVTKNIPVGRIGQPEDIANAVLFFADEAASYVNGQVLYVAGGPAD